ncbi:hypothetical protein D3C80_1549330 [compost metagenome]
MIEQQTQIRLTLLQFSRHIALRGAGQLHFQAGKLLGQGFEAVEYRLIRHRLVLSQAQARLLSAHQRLRPAIEALALAQHLPRLLQQCATGLGQPWLATTATIKQADAKVCFKQGNRTADRRLCLALIPGHGGKRTLLGDADEQAHLLQIPLNTHGSTHLQIR